MKPTYEEFEKGFLNHEYEAWISFDGFLLALIDAPKKGPLAACAYVRKDPEKWNFSAVIRRIFNKDIIFEKVFSSREELINGFMFEGKTIRDIYEIGELS